MSTSEHYDADAVNYGMKRNAAERLHYWLHLIVQSTERDVASIVVDAVAGSFGADAVGRLVDAVQDEAEAVRW